MKKRARNACSSAAFSFRRRGLYAFALQLLCCGFPSLFAPGLPPAPFRTCDPCPSPAHCSIFFIAPIAALIDRPRQLRSLFAPLLVEMALLASLLVLLALLGTLEAISPSLGVASFANSAIGAGFKSNMDIYKNGVVGLLRSIKEANRLRKVVNEGGRTALSFSEFQFLEQSKQDLHKAVRLLLMLPLSPHYFILSYVISPLVSKNPWIWTSLPSTFDSEQHKAAREATMEKRRLLAAISSLNKLKAESIDGKDDRQKAKRAEQVQLIHKALSQRTEDDALDELRPFIFTPTNKAKSLTSYSFPPSIVRECTRCFGVDGVAAWAPLVRRMNNMELGKYISRLQRSDSFLQAKGTHGLTDKELRQACFERYLLPCFSCAAVSARAPCPLFCNAPSA